MSTLFRPLSTFKDVPPASFDGQDRFAPWAAPAGTWPAPAGGAARTGRSATPLVQDNWSVVWQGPLGGAARPDSLLVGHGRVVVNGAEQRGVWTADGHPVGQIPRTLGTAFLDADAARLLVDDAGGVVVYTLDAKREASFFLSFSDPGSTREILHGPGVLAFLSIDAPPHSSPRVEMTAFRPRDYGRIKNGVLYGFEPLAGITRSDDRDVRAAAGRTGPVIATSAGVVWCDWQFRPLHESVVAGTPWHIAVDQNDRAVVVAADESLQARLRIIPPGAPPAVDLLLPSSDFTAAPPIVSPSGQIFLTPPGAIVAISPDGKLLWQQARASSARASVSANGLLLVAADSVDAVTPEGRHLTLWRPPAPIVAGPVLVGDRMYLASAETLYALRTE